MIRQDKEILDLVAQAIYDKKGFNILGLDVQGISTMTNYYIIAEGSVNRHVKSLSTYVKDKLAEVGREPHYIEGGSEGEWIVMDYYDVVIHLFVPELRERYAVEELWQKSEIIDFSIKTSKEEFSYPTNQSFKR